MKISFSKTFEKSFSKYDHTLQKRIYDAIVKSIHLRYSLLPYIYSAAWDITNSQSTMMRALVMDFKDAKVRDMNHEYMFGKSILVAPIVNAQYTPETIVKSDEQTG